MILQLLGICPILVAYTITLADVVDNGLVGEPVIECGSESLSVRFKTRSPFEGHLYVKGHYWKSNCRSDASLQNTVNLTVTFSSCNVVRQRSNNPKGMMLTSTVIMSFHPMFITKVDKSYKVQCFYAETVRTVSQNLTVSEGREIQRNVLVVHGGQGAAPGGRPPSVLHDDTKMLEEDTLTSTAPLPGCRYQVLEGGKNGNPLNYASVGQLVYHKWTCDPAGTLSGDSPFCATVHSCNVREDSGREVLLLDENGCAVDRYLLNNLEYTSDLTGGQLSQVFKFADQPSLFFHCQIRLTLKEGPVCKRSSDDCPKVLRGKRSMENEDHENNVDVVSPYMTVFDIDTLPEFPSASASKEQYRHGDICISSLTAGSLLSLFASSLLICIVAIASATCWKVSDNVKLEDYEHFDQ